MSTAVISEKMVVVHGIVTVVLTTPDLTTTVEERMRPMTDVVRLSVRWVIERYVTHERNILVAEPSTTTVA